jgi:HEPN domain-containing protein
MSGSESRELIQWREAQRWLAKADEDLAAARVLIGGSLADPAAFHVQQAVEKALKALLVAANQEIRRTHDLETLSSEVSKHWPSLASLASSLTSVSEWYLISRYPDMEEMTPTLDEIAGVLGQVELLIREIKAKAPSPVSKPGPTDKP